MRSQYVTELSIIATPKEMAVDINCTVLVSWPSLRSVTCFCLNCSGLMLFLKLPYLPTSREKNPRFSRTNYLFYPHCRLLYFYLYHNFSKHSLAVLCCSFFIIYERFHNYKSSCKGTEQKNRSTLAGRPPVSLYSFHLSLHCLTLCIVVSDSSVIFSLRDITHFGPAQTNRQVFLYRIHVWEDSPVQWLMTLLLVWSPSWGIFVYHSSTEHARLYLK